MGAWGLCPLASTAQSPGTPRNLRNAPALLKLVCCAQKTRAWARENFGCEHRVKGTDFCHGFMAASPFLFPVSPLWAITLYLIFCEKSFNFSLLISPHMNPSCIYMCSHHFPTNKSSGTFRQSEFKLFSLVMEGPSHAACALSGFADLSHLISNTSLPELGLLLALASRLRWTPFVCLNCITRSTCSSYT